MIDGLLGQAEGAVGAPSNLDRNEHRLRSRVDRHQVELVATDVDVSGEDGPADRCKTLGDEVLRSVSVSLSIRPHPADRTRRGFAGAYPVPASTRAWLSANSIEPPVSSSASGAGSNPGSSAGSSPKRSRET